MHSHGYKGRKFHRETDQRRALLKGLSDSLIKYEAIETTLPKAKDVLVYTEKLITKAKKGDLASRRRIIAKLQTLSSAHKLVDELAPKLKSRNSGHLRIERTSLRRGDNAQMARISFIFDESPKPKEIDEQSPTKEATTKPKTVSKSSVTSKTKDIPKKSATPKATTKKETK